MIRKCASDCKHPFLFQHSLITNELIVKNPDGSRTKVTTVTLVCRECGHWVAGKPRCSCPYECHKEEGVWVTTEPLVMVS
jgi:rubrerythrin